MHGEKIINIKKIGKIQTIDIEVNHPNHVFYGNEIATSNSHGVSYGIDAYWTAYLKAHFPHQFYCSYLHGAQWKQDTAEEVYEIVNNAKLADVEVCVPDFRNQHEIPYLCDNKVYFGISDIKQIGAAALLKVKEKTKEASDTINKKANDWTWLDYLLGFSSGVSSTVNEAIISAGGLDYLKKSRSSMLYEMELCGRLTKKEREWIVHKHGATPYVNLLSALRGCASTKKEGGGCHNQKRVNVVTDIGKILANPPHTLHDTADFIAWCEDKYLGTSITCSKVDGCEKAVEANATCRDIVNGRSGYTVLAVEVRRVHEVKTKRGKTPGKKMAFIGVSDSSCAMDDIVVFPDQWKEYGGLLHEDNTVLIQGENGSKKGDSFKIKKVWQI